MANDTGRNSRLVMPLSDAARGARSIGVGTFLLEGTGNQLNIIRGTARAASKANMDMLVAVMPWDTTLAEPLSNGNGGFARLAKDLQPNASMSKPSTGSIRKTPPRRIGRK